MPLPLPDLELIQRLLLSAGVGALLGLERQWRLKSAGLRTHILIALGSTVFTIVSYELASGVEGADPGRVAAQIVTGIGFLGAGAIMRTDSGIHGLTTAATVWVNASLGMAVGAGRYHLAFIGAAVTLSALLILHPLEVALDRRLRGPHSRRHDDTT
jgi:putative Mg2+ transporter-C (MgtC) family protein